MAFELSNQIVLLTGVGGGIGNAFLHFLLSKVKMLITSSRSTESEILDTSIRPKNFKHYSYDLTNEDNVKKLMKRIQEEHGKIDVLINTIGGSLYSYPIEEYPLEAFRHVFQVNLDSAFLLTREAIKLMKEFGGNMIHIISSSAYNIARNKAPYGMAKAALAKMIHYAASELAHYNIRVNGISPTYVFTPRHNEEIKKKSYETNKTAKEISQEILKSQLIKKQLTGKDMIPLMELLATTQVITGQIYHCTLGEVIK